jgi:hypothetical protein
MFPCPYNFTAGVNPGGMEIMGGKPNSPSFLLALSKDSALALAGKASANPAAPIQLSDLMPSPKSCRYVAVTLRGTLLAQAATKSCSIIDKVQ